MMCCLTSIDHSALRSFNLNLLVAFDALVQERSVTRAAARLRIGQPAMSHSLSTLRVLLADELFVRVGQVMQPTTTAMELAGPVQQVLAGAQEALLRSSGFDPGTAQRVFTVGSTSEHELVLVPALTAAWREQAPGVRLHHRAVDPRHVGRALDDGLVDAVIGCVDASDSWHRSERLGDEMLTCCFDPRHVLVGERLTVAEYTGLPHVTVSFDDTMAGCLDEGLARAGVMLNVVAACSSFTAAMVAAASSEVITTVPTQIAQHLAARLGLRQVPVPLDFPSRALSLVWHARSDGDPGATWLRDQVRAVVRADPALPPGVRAR